VTIFSRRAMLHGKLPDLLRVAFLLMQEQQCQ
jgi:hypothetical protein